MTDDDVPDKPQIRIRKRTREGGIEPRLSVTTAPPERKKRQPNKGSMGPGETRNPNGRPKGAKGTKAITRKVLSEPIPISTPKGKRKVSFYEALLLKERELAFKGDRFARKNMLELGRWALVEPADSPGANNNDALVERDDETDKAIIAWFDAERRRLEEQEEDADDPSPPAKTGDEEDPA